MSECKVINAQVDRMKQSWDSRPGRGQGGPPVNKKRCYEAYKKVAQKEAMAIVKGLIESKKKRKAEAENFNIEEFEDLNISDIEEFDDAVNDDSST